MNISYLVVGVVTFALAGCAAYAPKPLPERVNLLESTASMVIDPARLPFRVLSTHLFNPLDGLDMDEVAMLAVANNPQLRRLRFQPELRRYRPVAALFTHERGNSGRTAGKPGTAVAGMAGGEPGSACAFFTDCVLPVP